jgi:hypothetical protein
VRAGAYFAVRLLILGGDAGPGKQGIQLGVNYNTIPNTDLQVSQLCMGTATFGQEMMDEDAHKMLDMACKQYGINFLVNC